MSLQTARLPLIIALFIIGSDQMLKLWTHLTLPVMRSYWLWYPYGGIGVFKNFLGIEFSLSHQINYGAAWGVLADYQQPLLYLRLALILTLIIYCCFFNKESSLQLPLALITAGAIGNVIDHFTYGHVIDMFHFVLWGYDFPVFNIADSAIFIGISWLLIATQNTKELPQKRQRQR